MFKDSSTRLVMAELFLVLKNWKQLDFLTVGSVQFTRVCLILFDPTDCSTPGLPVHHQLLKLMSIVLVMPSNHLILCRPLFLLPSIFPSIRICSNESVLCIRWPKYCSFSFSMSPYNEYSGLISFRIDWFDFLTVSVILYNFFEVDKRSFIKLERISTSIGWI